MADNRVRHHKRYCPKCNSEMRKNGYNGAALKKYLQRWCCKRCGYNTINPNRI